MKHRRVWTNMPGIPELISLLENPFLTFHNEPLTNNERIAFKVILSRSAFLPKAERIEVILFIYLKKIKTLPFKAPWWMKISRFYVCHFITRSYAFFGVRWKIVNLCNSSVGKHSRVLFFLETPREMRDARINRKGVEAAELQLLCLKVFMINWSSHLFKLLLYP